MLEPIQSQPSGPSREAILDLLRRGPVTAQLLADRVGLTQNGIRAQLATLERDGLVSRTGVRHRGSRGKPPILFGLSQAGEEALSRVYPAALSSVTAVMRDQMSGVDLETTFREAGRRLGRSVRSDDCQAVLASLGAQVEISHEADGTEKVVGGNCPLGAVVRETPAACELVRSLLATSLEREVEMCCEHGDNPRCGFRIPGAQRAPGIRTPSAAKGSPE